MKAPSHLLIVFVLNSVTKKKMPLCGCQDAGIDMCVCVCVCVCLCVYEFVCVCMSLCVCVCMFLLICVFVCVWIY